MAEVREVTHYRVSIAAALAALTVPFAGCQAVKEYRMPDRVKACVEGGGSWEQAYQDDKATDHFDCFPPKDVGTRG